MSPTDIQTAALELPLLEVARAWVASPASGIPRTGETTLVAMRSRPGDQEPQQAPETPAWLESIRRRLAPRVPLGSRLVVRAPRYVDVIVRAAVEAEKGRDPSAVRTQVLDALRRRFAMVELRDGSEPRDPGDPVTRRDVAAWIRSVSGVRRIVSLELRRNGGPAADRIDVGSDRLPRWLPDADSVTVVRSAATPRSEGAAR